MVSNKTGADLSTIPRSQKILYISEEANSEETELMIDESAVTEGESYKVVVSQDRLEKPMLVDNIFYTSFNDLRLHLQQKKYDKIISHSVSNRVLQVLDGTDTSETDIIFRPQTSILALDYEINEPYFKRYTGPEKKQVLSSSDLLESITRYNKLDNVSWIFTSKNTLMDTEKQLKIQFKNSVVIPPLLSDAFLKEINDKRPANSIVLIKRSSNRRINTLDEDVLSLLYLSEYPLFKELDITIYSKGPSEDRDVLLAPLKNMANVKVHPTHLTNLEESEILKNNTLLLCSDRYDKNINLITKAVASGTIPITTTSSSIHRSYTDLKHLAYCDDHPQEAAQKIIDVLNHSNENQNTLKELRDSIDHENKSNIKQMKKIIGLKKLDQTYTHAPKASVPTLSVVVPSYNVEPYLRNVVLSLINQPLSHKIEVIIVNDGSKDNTANIANELVKLSETKNGPIVTLIDKENGGHGSTINAGIKAAKGKYFKLLDGDDYVLTDNFIELIKILENEDSDIILTDLVEDYGVSAEKQFKDYYGSLPQEKKLRLDNMHLPGYGFGEWGPLLSTTTVKTEILKNADFQIDENCFYVDMEYNFIIYSLSETVTYYPLVIYSYYLGRVGQSMSKESLKRNVLHHEKVTLRLLSEYKKREDTLSNGKKAYLKNKIIIPMCKSQYYIASEMFDTGDNFMSFDKKFKSYPEFYNHPDIAGKIIRLHRATKGKAIRADEAIKKLKSKIRKGA